MHLRPALLWILSILLLLTIARQALDFLGYLWLSILVNFAHIVATIVALFGTAQMRPGLLMSYVAWLLVWTGWNAFLVVYQLSLGGLDRQAGWLGLGLRGSRSFWLLHTPLCPYSYHYETGAWLPDKDCWLPYHWVEAIVAIVHAAAALLTLCLCLAFLCLFSKAWKEERKAAQPRVTVQFTQPHQSSSSTAFSALPNGSDSLETAKRNPGYVSDSSGYLNTSFEPNSPSPLDRQQAFLPQLGHNGNLVQGSNPRRSSKKKKRRQVELEHLNGTESDVVYGDLVSGPGPSRSADQFSQAATVEASDGGGSRQRGGTRAHSSTRESREARAARRRERQARSVSPASRRRPPSASTLQSQLQSQLEAQPSQGCPSYVPAYRQRASSGSRPRPYRHYNGGGLARPPPASQPELLGPATAAQGDPEASVLAYPSEPQRISVAEPRALLGSKEPILRLPGQEPPSRQRQPPVPSSLISFDPKSDQTLLRYQTHLSRSRDALQSSRTDDSADSPPLEMAPTIAGPLPNYHQQYQKRTFPASHRYQQSNISDRISYDSGVPSSLGNGGGSEGSSTSSQPSSDSAVPSRPSPPQRQESSLPSTSLSYYEPPKHFRGGSGSSQLPPPPPLAPVRDGVLMAVDANCSFDSTFSMPPPPPPPPPPPEPPSKPTPPSYFLPPLSAQLSAASAQLPPSSGQQHSPALPYAQGQLPPPPPLRDSPRLQHQHSLLV